MNVSKFILFGVVAGLLTFSSGCSWFKSSEDIDPSIPGVVPGPEANPGNFTSGPISGGPGGNTADLNQFSGQTEQLSPTPLQDGGGESFAGGPGDWPLIPGLDFPTIYFAYDQESIAASERPKLEQTADYLNKNTSVGLVVEGNCDERGSAEYNRALGERRALAIKQYLTGLGVAENRIKTISYGEERPADASHTPEAYAKNRRGELHGAQIR
ncbi:MAG: peptidoglycan-associated lipoprotein Pal [Victivallales bacterium]|nr:peptidoglycan-associated lipoprotein Pal [Victivallales bacterium]